MLLTEERVNAINEVRTLLERLSKEATEEGYAILKAGEPTYVANPMDNGRLAEAAHMAEDALFRVLNVASSHLGKDAEPFADRWIQIGAWREAHQLEVS
jgi:hypothetical protein